jgi:hypothetical protein
MAERAPQGDDTIGAVVRLSRSAVRLVAITAPAVPIGTTVGLQMSRGWRPTSDDAAIAWRTWDVFSAHAPLLGAFNDATQSSGQPVFDPGPLEYYLLAAPERIDPMHGILWGAALLCAVLAGLAVEAAWRAGGALPAISVGAAFVVLAATQPIVMVNLAWNPNLGIFAFSAALVLSVVAATGRLRWWPVAVVAGSLAAQCHLVFGLAVAACLLVGLVLGGTHRLRNGDTLTGSGEAGAPPATPVDGHGPPGDWGAVLRPAFLGIAIGLLTLAAPLAQQAADNPGNLMALLRSVRHQGLRLGFAFGLRGVGRIAGIPPAWARRAPPTSGANWYAEFRHALFGGSAATGAALLAATALVAGIAFVARRPGLAALATVAVVSGLAVSWTFGSIAEPFESVITYTDVALWPVGMALDASIVWGAFAVAAAGVRHLPAAYRLPSWQVVRHRTAAAKAAAGVIAAVVVFAPLLVWSVTTLVPITSTDVAVIGGWDVARAVAPLARSLDVSHPNEPVLVEPSVPLLPSGLPTWAVTEGLAYELKVEGIDVRLMPPMQPELGPDAAPAQHEITYLVEPRPSGWVLVRVAKPRPTRILDFVMPG